MRYVKGKRINRFWGTEGQKGKNKGRELCLKKQNKIRKGWKHFISRILI